MTEKTIILDYDLVVVSGHPAGEVYDREVKVCATMEAAEMQRQQFEADAKAAGLWDSWTAGPHIYEVHCDETDEFVRNRLGDR